MPEISIILTCYNYGEFIFECLSSIKNQSFTNWECIVVDDGSTDNSKQQVECFLSDGRIRYIYQENAGVSSARNNGLNQSNGTFVICIDADDTISPLFLEKLLVTIKSDESVFLVYPEVVLFGERRGIWNLPNYTYSNLLRHNMLVVSALYKKVDFETSGGYDTNMEKGSEDWEYWIRLLNVESKVVKVKEAILNYRIKSTSKNGLLLADSDTRNATYRYITKKHALIYKEHFESPLVLYHELHQKEWLYFHRPWIAWYRKIFKK